LSDSLYSSGPTNSLAGSSISTVDTLRAYFQIVEVSSVLGLERDSCDHAIQLFRDCLSTTYLRNRNIEALATAALVQAIREQNEPRTLQVWFHTQNPHLCLFFDGPTIHVVSPAYCRINCKRMETLVGEYPQPEFSKHVIYALQ
jgi:hypothetical protein